MKIKKEKPQQWVPPHTAINMLAVVFLVFISLSLMACKDDDDNGGSPIENNFLVGEGICVTEQHPDITITLTVDSQNVAYISTDSNFYMVIKPGMYIGIADGAKYVVHKNNMYGFLEGYDVIYEESAGFGFKITKLSKNSIKLEYFGMVPGYNLSVVDYLFTKNNGGK